MFFQTVRRLFSNRKCIDNVRSLHKISLVSDIYAQRIEGLTTVKGWVKGLRIQKKNVFLDISDGSCNEILQIFLPKEKAPENLTWGSSIEVTGSLSTTPRGQPELVAEEVKIFGVCVVTDGYPFNPRQIHPPEYIRQYLHLRPRINYNAALLRVRDTATRAINEYFRALNYINIHVPILTSNDCEGAGEVFRVEPENQTTIKAMMREGNSPHDAYFGSKTFLTVSGQLHLEAVAHGLSKVYTFGPTFRAENSKSRLHLSEFYMVEAEVAFVDDIEIIKSLIEGLLKNVTKTLLKDSQSDLAFLRKDCEAINWLEKPFNSITYDDALKLLGDTSFKEDGLGKEDELRLVELLGGPTFVTHWPKSIKPFYMRTCADQPEKVAALDLLVPIVGEVAGGSLRENSYERLKEKLPSPAMDWYLQLRKFGSVPTGGFGLGFERYLQLVCAIPNIKDTIPFPRWPHNCSL